ncbi:MAG: FAD-dependent thymidylate synthase [Thermoplasmata archaeon]|nr:FAD-dependent thymidylate synthase [Thermoplasmata archaeon]
MKVTLIRYTPEPEYTVALAAKTCHTRTVEDAMKLSEEEVRKIISIVLKSGHFSVLEHANFTFAIEDVSRVLTHQLVRHRIASYSQQSQRYVKLEDFPFVIPPEIEKNPEAKQIFIECARKCMEAYNGLIEAGLTIEDARYILPSATKTNIIVTMNARELHHFFALRCCERSQWEIRELARAMLGEVKKVAPNIFVDAGPECARSNCPEGDFSCLKEGEQK